MTMSMSPHTIVYDERSAFEAYVIGQVARRFVSLSEGSLGLVDQPGESFEGVVAAAFRLIPRAQPHRSRLVGGKKVDILVAIKGRLTEPDRTIAVECKDYKRRLTREQVVKILYDYQPLLSRGLVDAVHIVTRNGIVDSANDALDGKATCHYTHSDLVRDILDLGPLVQDMREQYFLGELDRYYEPLRCTGVDLKLVSKNFDKYYSPFLDFAISRLIAEYGSQFLQIDSESLLKTARMAWRQHCRELDRQDLVPLSNGYNPEDFVAMISSHFQGQKIVDLEKLIFQWAKDGANHYGMALLGAYGTGKSTFSRRLAWRCAEDYQLGKFDRVPLLIELRNLTSDQDIDKLITHELADRHRVEGATATRFHTLNRAGLFLLILDGFDEMKNGMSREALAHNLAEINKLLVPNAKVLLSGRPTIFADELEQRELLQSTVESHGARSSSQYIPVSIAPLAESRIMPLVRAYAAAQGMLADMSLASRIDKMEQALPDRKELQELLARPVHIPMLLRVLPSLRSDPSRLRRSDLYLQFIDQTLQREVQKRRFAGSFLTVEQRRDFASRLACEMLRQGESRSISASQIPNDLIQRYRPRTKSLETTKRELISACFLEFKPPDMLIFGHKSYCEFLCALRFRDSIREAGNVKDILPLLTPEVRSFLLDLLDVQDIDRMVSSLVEYWPLMFLVVSATSPHRRVSGLRKRAISALFSDEVMNVIKEKRLDRDDRFMLKYCEFCQSAPQGIPDECQNVIAMLSLASYSENVYVAVHALRALPVNCRPTVYELERRLGTDKFNYWNERGWIDSRILCED
jgi:NACHT domain-containing protein